MSASRTEPGRRLVVMAAACVAAGAAAADVPAQQDHAAPPKLSLSAAQYQDTPRGGLRCVGCTFFRRPASCQVVEGEISPNGWCRLFDLPD